METTATLERLPKAAAHATDCARQAGMIDLKINHIELVFEEPFINCRKHGDATTIQMNYSTTESGEFQLILCDDGIAFDITEKEDPDLSIELGNRAIGGLGIFLSKQSTRDLQYRREGSKNILTALFSEGDPK